MGVSFTWRLADPNHGISWGSGSKLHSALVELFGDFPLTLSHTAIPKLEGLSAGGFGDVLELINAILNNDKIEVLAHW